MAACTSWTSLYVAGPLRDLCIWRDLCGLPVDVSSSSDLRVSGETSSGFPSMYRSPKLRVAQRGRVVWPSLTIVDLCGTSADLCGASAGPLWASR